MLAELNRFDITDVTQFLPVLGRICTLQHLWDHYFEEFCGGARSSPLIDGNNKRLA
jgi:hypothetical protein